ncbi:MAG TPA: ABC transporter permease subunit [Clostridiales bacterium]|nr:ABC transporter permease subunit [Clostridiales bacterium]
MKKAKKHYSFIYIILGIMFLLALWTVLQKIINNNLVVPDIPSVFRAFLALLKQSKTYFIILKTIGRLIITLIFCAALTLILSYFSYKFEWFENFIKPFFSIMRTVPVVSLIIILLFLAGNDISPYFITALVILPVMYEGILSGFLAIDDTLKDELRLLSSVNFKIIMSVFIPMTLPYLIASFLQSFGLGLKVMVMSEFIAQPKDTIGYVMLQERIYLDTADIFAWTIIMALFVFLVELVVKTIRKRI